MFSPAAHGQYVHNNEHDIVSWHLCHFMDDTRNITCTDLQPKTPYTITSNNIYSISVSKCLFSYLKLLAEKIISYSKKSLLIIK